MGSRRSDGAAAMELAPVAAGSGRIGRLRRGRHARGLARRGAKGRRGESAADRRRAQRPHEISGVFSRRRRRRHLARTGHPPELDRRHAPLFRPRRLASPTRTGLFVEQSAEQPHFAASAAGSGQSGARSRENRRRLSRDALRRRRRRRAGRRTPAGRRSAGGRLWLRPPDPAGGHHCRGLACHCRFGRERPLRPLGRRRRGHGPTFVPRRPMSTVPTASAAVSATACWPAWPTVRCDSCRRTSIPASSNSWR